MMHWFADYLKEIDVNLLQYEHQGQIRRIYIERTQVYSREEYKLRALICWREIMRRAGNPNIGDIA